MHAHRFNAEQIEFIKQELGDLIYYFGYSNLEEKSITNFFEFNNHTEVRKALHNGFIRTNAESLAEVCEEPRKIKVLKNIDKKFFD